MSNTKNGRTIDDQNHSHPYLDTNDVPLEQLHKGLVVFNAFSYVFEEMRVREIHPMHLVHCLEKDHIWMDADNGGFLTNDLRQIVHRYGKLEPITKYPRPDSTVMTDYKWDIEFQRLVFNLGFNFVTDNDDTPQLFFDQKSYIHCQYTDEQWEAMGYPRPQMWGLFNWERLPRLLMRLKRFIGLLDTKLNEDVDASEMGHYWVGRLWNVESNTDYDELTEHYEAVGEVAWSDLDTLCTDCWLDKHSKMLVPDFKSLKKQCGCQDSQGSDSCICMHLESGGVVHIPKIALCVDEQFISKDGAK